MTWQRQRLAHVADEVRRVVDPLDFGEEKVLHYSIPALDETGGAVIETASEIGSSKLLARGGEVAISKLNPRKARVVEIEQIDDLPILCSGELVVIRPRQIHRRFLYWLLNSDHLRQELDGRVQSVTRSHQRVRPDAVMKLTVQLPVAAAQRRISESLDTETARIDALIDKKREVLTLLDERRRSILAFSVAGHDVRLTRVARLGSGHTPSRERPEWWLDCTIPWITTGEVAQMRSDRIEYITGTRERISQLGLANSSAELHPAGTVVLSRTASAGYSAIMGVDMATSQDFATWTCGPRLRPRYLLLCLRAMRADLLGRLAMGSTHQTIYMPDIASIRIPLPSLDAQDRAVEDTWRRLRLLADAADRLTRQIELLREHRQALITAAVTGELAIP